MAPLQIKHRYKVSEEIGSLVVSFPIFLLIFFDTLNWSRAGCIHEAPKRIFRDHVLQTLGKQVLCPFRHFLVQEDLPSKIVYLLF